jgi:hypothetical protein
MKTVKILLFVAVAVALLGAAINTANAAQKRHDILYYCNCGPDCNCNSVSTKPGNCKCGKPMKAGHVLKIEGTVAYVCTCGAGCNCKIDPNDPSKCGCGNPVKKIDLKGTGIYFCACGGGCSCNTVSDKPGKCKCGKALKKVD